MSWHERTIQTYNTSAEQLAAHFKGVGARTEDIDRGLRLADAKSDARVVEIGCGDGRDAEEIFPRVGWYEGIDPSSSLLVLARRRLPDASFVEADALSYDYPENLDVIFAFASLLHIQRNDIPTVLDKGRAALKDGGIYYLSLKERSQYTEELQKDQFGERMFYYYNPPIIKELAGVGFRTVYEVHYTIGHTDWFSLALQKS